VAFQVPKLGRAQTDANRIAAAQRVAFLTLYETLAVQAGKVAVLTVSHPDQDSFELNARRSRETLSQIGTRC
jgi:hypothetical protein